MSGVARRVGARAWRRALAWAGLALLAGPAAGSPPARDGFTLTTFNVQLHQFDNAETVAAVGLADADVVCLQEVTPGWVAALERTYARRYPHRVYRPRGGAGGLAVLSRFPLAEGEVLSGNTFPGWFVTAETPDGPVQLLVVHLRAPMAGPRGMVGAVLAAGPDHVADLRTFLAQREAGVPLVVTGDFNEGPDGDGLAFLGTLGFRSALAQFHPGRETWRYPSLFGQATATLDHVLFDPGLEALDADVAAAGHSDHLPLTARLRLRTR